MAWLIRFDNEGGSAFPDQLRPGMSLRDWFAGQALGGLTAALSATIEPVTADELIHRLASRSYIIADAMLAEREKERI